MKILAAVAAVLWAVACSARPLGPPEIVLDRSACRHCGMLISERVYAAALRTPDGGAQVFDDIGCLLAAVRKHSLSSPTIWVHDANRGAWLDGASAVYVASPSLKTPMAGGVIAFADRASADRAAATLAGASVTSLDALLAQKGAAQ